MTFRDLVELSFSNLYRTKLRTLLTVSGVIIAISTFTAMISFGAGNQQLVNDTYKDLGLFTSMKVYPIESPAEGDSIEPGILNKEAVSELAKIPGVVLAYPFVDFTVTAGVLDTQITSEARALPVEALDTPIMRKLLNGYAFSSDSAKEAIVTPAFIEKLNTEYPDSLIGKELIVSLQIASLDSALINVLDDNETTLYDRFEALDPDSLLYMKYIRRVARQELGEGIKRLIDGFFNRTMTVADTLTIVGIGEKQRQRQFTLSPIVMPERTARLLTTAGFGIGNDPLSLFEAMRSGEFFPSDGSERDETYPRVTLELDPYVSYEGIKDSVEAMGFRAFSYAEEFKEIQRFFLYFNAALGVVGLIALMTASLGIINTLLMSINERRKEIGILQSLGAYRTDIWVIFLSESGAIGFAGSVFGIIFGWLGTRAMAFVLKLIMENEGIPVVDPFALPFWLIGLSMVFGISVSILAGLYPAAKAARVDPVEALRGE